LLLCSFLPPFTVMVIVKLSCEMLCTLATVWTLGDYFHIKPPC
jgi:hypothetical protein